MKRTRVTSHRRTSLGIRRSRRPWRGAGRAADSEQMKPYESEGIILDEPPNAQIDIYTDLVVLTRRTRNRWKSYPIDPGALAAALAGLPTVSGLLPPNTLGTGIINGYPFYVLYVPPMPATITTATALGEQRYEMLTPPLVWAGLGTDYRIWALGKEGYPDARQALYHAPFPNNYDDGRICWGNADVREPASSRTMLPTLKLFLEGSRFNDHAADNKSQCRTASVLARYPDLEPGAPYPLDDLVESTVTLDWVVNGDLWRHQR